MTVSRQDFEEAIAAYWGVKDAQFEVSVFKDTVGAGTSGAIRGGKHFDPVAALLGKFFLDAGYPPADIRISTKQHLELPGYYRPHEGSECCGRAVGVNADGVSAVGVVERLDGDLQFFARYALQPAG
ncbi:hypothetical protein ACYF6T_43765 [Streptomyces sp. 7R007]